MFGRRPEPLDRLGVVLLDALPHFKGHPEVVLGRRPSLFGGFAEQFEGLGLVQPEKAPLLVEPG